MHYNIIQCVKFKRIGRLGQAYNLIKAGAVDVSVLADDATTTRYRNQLKPPKNTRNNKTVKRASSAPNETKVRVE